MGTQFVLLLFLSVALFSFARSTEPVVKEGDDAAGPVVPGGDGTDTPGGDGTDTPGADGTDTPGGDSTDTPAEDQEETSTEKSSDFTMEICVTYKTCNQCQNNGCFWHGDGVCRNKCYSQVACLRGKCEICEMSGMPTGVNYGANCTKPCPSPTYGCFPNCYCRLHAVQYFDPIIPGCFTIPDTAAAFYSIGMWYQITKIIPSIRTQPVRPFSDLSPGGGAKGIMKKINYLKFAAMLPLMLGGSQKIGQDPVMESGAIQTLALWLTDKPRQDNLERMVLSVCQKGFYGMYEYVNGYDRFEADFIRWRHMKHKNLLYERFPTKDSKGKIVPAGGAKPVAPKDLGFKKVTLTGKDDVFASVNNYGLGSCRVWGGGALKAYVKEFAFICSKFMNWYDCEKIGYCYWTGPMCIGKQPPEEEKKDDEKKEGDEDEKKEEEEEKEEEDKKGKKGKKDKKKKKEKKQKAVKPKIKLINALECVGYPSVDECGSNLCEWREPTIPVIQLSLCGTLGNICCTDCPCIEKGLRCIFGICQGCERDDECPNGGTCENMPSDFFPIFDEKRKAAMAEMAEVVKKQISAKRKDITKKEFPDGKEYKIIIPVTLPPGKEGEEAEELEAGVTLIIAKFETTSSEITATAMWSGVEKKFTIKEFPSGKQYVICVDCSALIGDYILNEDMPCHKDLDKGPDKKDSLKPGEDSEEVTKIDVFETSIKGFVDKRWCTIKDAETGKEFAIKEDFANILDDIEELEEQLAALDSKDETGKEGEQKKGKDGAALPPQALMVPQNILVCHRPSAKRLESLVAIPSHVEAARECQEMTQTQYTLMIGRYLRWVDINAKNGEKYATAIKDKTSSGLKKLGGLKKMMYFILAPMLIRGFVMLICFVFKCFGAVEAIQAVFDSPIGEVMSFFTFVIWRLKITCGGAPGSRVDGGEDVEGDFLARLESMKDSILDTKKKFEKEDRAFADYLKDIGSVFKGN